MKLVTKVPGLGSKMLKRHEPSNKGHIEFIHKGGKVKVVKVKPASEKARRLVERMAGSGNGKFTTEQIIKLMRG